MNSNGGNRRFVSKHQLESKASAHGTAKRGASATAVNEAMFRPGGGAAAVANAGPADRHQPKRSIATAHGSLGQYSDGGGGGGDAGMAERAGSPIPFGALRVEISPQTEADLREVFTFYCQYGDRLNTSFLSNAKTAKLAKDVGIIPHLVPSAVGAVQVAESS
jgi:hypothetical protein